MRILPWAFGAAGMLLLGLAIGLGIWAGMPANPLTALRLIVGYSGALSKLCYPLLAGLAIWTLVLVALRLAGRPLKDLSLLTILSLVPPAIGLVVLLLTGLIILRVAAQTHTTDLIVIAPGLAEAITPFAFGLIIGAVAATLKAAPTGRTVA
ncbi:hypothetical protein [Caulobacter sp. BE254]|uniref:hypothetical protein n=1 Tax=Caulobacter sp. BE254 TaxID=2817720 RepID=UPI002856B970|nr:hypothetical protein [Caulobacter sp. BE254]MDR7118588.1 ABC-type antimicrobial peptide transport system permease subunit [Caulobacter sp. BE254]